jgi:hypothetical protein
MLISVIITIIQNNHQLLLAAVVFRYRISIVRMQEENMKEKEKTTV